jgi:HSP20 family protein
MMLIRKSPTRLYEFGRVQRVMDRFFDEGVVRPVERRWSWFDRLPVDVYATPESFVIQANVPGVKPQDVSITIEGDTLTIKATLPGSVEGVEYSLRERSSGEYERRLNFNVPIQPDAAEATFENGVLTLTVPKSDDVRPKKIEIKAG